MDILLIINAVIFMLASAAIWLPLTFLWCFFTLCWDSFSSFLYLINDNGFQFKDILWAITVGFSEAISKIDDLFKWFWQFARYDHPILALCGSIFLGGASSRV